jgi:hypothetical protein
MGKVGYITKMEKLNIEEIGLMMKKMEKVNIMMKMGQLFMMEYKKMTRYIKKKIQTMIIHLK